MCRKREGVSMKKTFILQGLDCAGCAAKMEEAIGKLDGVHAVSVNFFSQKLSIDADEERFDDILRKIRKTSRKIEPGCVILV